MARRSTSAKPLLSVEETAILLGETRSTLYRAIQAGTLPLPVYTIGGRIRIPRRAVERLIDGIDSPTDEEPRQAGFLDPFDTFDTFEGVSARRRPMCSAARRSSTARPSV
jgi:excisionase family DNA binding protein